MLKRAALSLLFSFLFLCSGSFAQGPCSRKNSDLACVIPQAYGPGGFSAAGQGVFANQEHEGHFDASIASSLAPLTKDIGRQTNLLPLASPSSGVLLTYDSTLKTFVTTTDSLGPILGERAETVGRHRIFLGFSYQFFDFDHIDGVNLHNFPAVFVHAPDTVDNPGKSCTANITSTANLNGCAFVRDLITTVNSVDLKVNQYTAYVTFGLTRHVDVSAVIPIENVRMKFYSNDTIIPGTNGFYTVAAGGTDAQSGFPHFDHLWAGCPNTKPASESALAPACLTHQFPDPSITQGGSNAVNSATGISDVVARVKWNAWEGERAGLAAGVDVRFATGDALNYLGSGSYGVKPFAVFSYRARVSPHVLVGYEWNSRSITAGDVTAGVKGAVPRDFVYSAGADGWITKWLTGSFDVVGQRFFGTQTVGIQTNQYLAPCGGDPTQTSAPPLTCTAEPSPLTVSHNTIVVNNGESYNVTNASMGIKLRPLPARLSHLVFTANVLVRLDDGGLSSRPAPLVGLGYTF
jgi:hypothetical protein